MTPTTYGFFDTAEQVERARLATHNGLWDTFTFRKLGELGDLAGWRCLEIGAGTGSVASWLLEQVGAAGHVVATDIETTGLEPLRAANLEVRYHNVIVDPLEQSGYDLIHARLVLEHLTQRDVIAAKLTRALRPGGWLVVEDYDIQPMETIVPAHAAWTAVHNAVRGVLRSSGVEPSYGSRLLPVLRSIGLADVSAEGYVRPSWMRDLAPVFRPVLARMRDTMLTMGAIDADALEQTLELFDSDEHMSYSPLLVSARGRRMLGACT